MLVAASSLEEMMACESIKYISMQAYSLEHRILILQGAVGEPAAAAAAENLTSGSRAGEATTDLENARLAGHQKHREEGGPSSALPQPESIAGQVMNCAISLPARKPCIQCTNLCVGVLKLYSKC